MDPMKNHEGYHDPTACRAIQNVARRTKKGKDGASRPLTYRLADVQTFRECTWLPDVILK